MTIIIIRASEPIPIPARFPNNLFHLCRSLGYFFQLDVIATIFCQPSHFLACQYEQTSDEHAFCNGTIFIGCGLEGLPWRIGETIQVQTIVPVCATNEGELIGSESFERILNGALQMFVKRPLTSRFIFILNKFIKN